jgi:hypothetical protein
MVLCDGRDGGYGARPAVPFTVAVAMRPCLCSLLPPELFQWCDTALFIARNGFGHALQSCRNPPRPAQDAIPPRQNPDRHKLGIALLCACLAPCECAEPSVSLVCKVDEIRRLRMQPRRQRLVLYCILEQYVGARGTFPGDCVAMRRASAIGHEDVFEASAPDFLVEADQKERFNLGQLIITANVDVACSTRLCWRRHCGGGQAAWLLGTEATRAARRPCHRIQRCDHIPYGALSN